MTSAAPFGLVTGSTGADLLAHQGGWDELLLVVGPLALVAGLLWLANRRVSAQLEEAESESGAETDAETGPEPTGEDGGSIEGSSGIDPRS